MPRSRIVRYQSTRTLFGRPLIAVAIGPNPLARERRGHARGIISIGDQATGWIALGGMARGFLAVGGLAVGGLAIGVIAIGGAAISTMALGGFAIGEHTVSGFGQDPVASDFFNEWLAWLRHLFGINE